jgi:hypothetical protein
MTAPARTVFDQRSRLNLIEKFGLPELQNRNRNNNESKKESKKNLAGAILIFLAAFGSYIFSYAYALGFGIINNEVAGFKIQMAGSWYPAVNSGGGLAFLWNKVLRVADSRRPVLLFSKPSLFFISQTSLLFRKPIMQKKCTG